MCVYIYIYIYYYCVDGLCGTQLLCSGMQIFTRAGVRMEEESSFEHKSWSTSQSSECYMATALVPNSRYTCHMVSMAGKKQSSTKLAPQIAFQTARGSEL